MPLFLRSLFYTKVYRNRIKRKLFKMEMKFLFRKVWQFPPNLKLVHYNSLKTFKLVALKVAISWERQAFRIKVCMPFKKLIVAINSIGKINFDQELIRVPVKLNLHRRVTENHQTLMTKYRKYKLTLKQSMVT